MTPINKDDTFSWQVPFSFPRRQDSSGQPLWLGVSDNTRMLLRITLIIAALLSVSTASYAADSTEQKLRIYVVGSRWHAGLMLPAASMNALVPSLHERFPKAESYEIGWGDMDFYQAEEVTVGLAIEALFFSKGSLLHVVGVPASVHSYLEGKDVAESCVSVGEYQRMARLIAQTFALGNDGKPVPLGAGLYGDSQFYKANGEYKMLNNCNQWSAEILKAGGLDISPRFSLTAGSALKAVRKQGKACTLSDQQ